MPKEPPRVLVIGARRSRQGTGEFVARWFREARAEVVAVVGTSRATVEEARAGLEQRHGITARGYLDLDEALRVERPEIAAICSPYERHAEHLERVAEFGANCLCEKPLWWEPGADLAAGASRLVERFERKGLHLALVTQWPYTLPFYFRLFPQLEGAAVERFSMTLSPVSAGPKMVLDAAPHPLSLLQALLGSGRVDNVRARFSGDGLDHLEASMDYRHRRGVTAVDLRFSRCESPPRPASYGINGHEAHRRVRLPDYELALEAAGRRVRLVDPLGLLIAEYLERTGEHARPQRAVLVEGMGNLEILHRAAETAVKRSALPDAALPAAGEAERRTHG